MSWLDPQPHVLNFLIPGFCGSRKSYEALRSEIQKRTGHDTTCIGSCRWGKSRVRDNRYRLPRVLFRQAQHAIHVIARRIHVSFAAANPSATVHLFGHSMGGAVAMIVALLAPGVVRRVYLLAPACMYRDNPLELYARALRKNKADRQMAKSHPDPEVRKRMRSRTWGMMHYMSNPWRTIGEGIALGRNGLYVRLVTELEKQGTEVFVIYADKDELFPVTLKYPRLSGKKVIVAKGTTHDLQLFPEIVGDCIDALHAAA